MKSMCDYDISRIHNNWYEEYKRGVMICDRNFIH